MPDIDRILGRPLDERESFRTFIEAIRLAESSARQLAFVQHRRQWLVVENALAAVRDRAAALAARGS